MCTYVYVDLCHLTGKGEKEAKSSLRLSTQITSQTLEINETLD